MSEKKIYNKNAREKALLEEAYNKVGVQEEGVFKDVLSFGSKLLGKKKKDPRELDLGPRKNKPNVRRDEVPLAQKADDWIKANPRKSTAIAVPPTGYAIWKGSEGIGGLGGSKLADVSGTKEGAYRAGQGKAIADNVADALGVGKWVIPAAVIGGGYLAGKALFGKKDEDKDEEESEEGGDLRAAEQEMIQRAQAGEDPHAALDEVAGNHGVDKETLKKAIFGESKIYNKNAREKSLLEEAYASVYREDTDKEKRYEDRWDKDLDKEREKEGSSSAGDYSDVDKDDFCGPAGGAAPGTYPVNSEKRARAALSYAHNAPDPEGIKRCVYRKAKKHGWFEEPEDEENPDAHTYSNLGREPGPAAELNPNIGFDEDEETVNENWLDYLQTGLTTGGLLPGLGIPIDLANAGISALRGKWGDAALNVGAAVPFAGYGANAEKIRRAAMQAKNLKSKGRVKDIIGGHAMTGRSKTAKGLETGGQVLKDLALPQTSHGDKTSTAMADWLSRDVAPHPSRAAILQGKGPKKTPPTKEQLHQRGQSTISPAPAPKRPPHWPSDEENIDIDLSKVEVVDVEGLNPNENEQDDARITKAYIHTEDGIRELTDAEYEYINDHELEFVHNAAESELIDYKAGMEDWPF